MKSYQRNLGEELKMDFGKECVWKHLVAEMFWWNDSLKVYSDWAWLKKTKCRHYNRVFFLYYQLTSLESFLVKYTLSFKMCVWVSEWVYTHSSGFMWRTENINTGLLVSIISPLWFLRQSLNLENTLFMLDFIGCWAPGICMSPCSSAGVIDAHLYTHFYMGAWGLHSVFLLVQQISYPLSHLPNPLFILCSNS